MRKFRSSESFDIHVWMRQRRLLDSYAESVLGHAGWRIFERFGRLMAGPKSGLYVSSLDSDEVTELIDDLAQGKVLSIHLMHRHVSGSYESSKLFVRDGRLVMRFPDRDEPALRCDRFASD